MRPRRAQDLLDSPFLGMEFGSRPCLDGHGRQFIEGEVLRASSTESAVKRLGRFGEADNAGMWAVFDIETRQAYHVKHQDFDELLIELSDHLNIYLPGINRWEELFETYEQQLTRKVGGA